MITLPSTALWLSLALLAPQDDPVSTSASKPWRMFASPEQAGWSVEALEEARAFAEAQDTAAFVCVFRGHVLCSWGQVERRFELHSVRKSLLSALIGIHVADGSIDLEATLEELGIDDLQGLTHEEKQARVVDLIRARSGVYHPAAKEPAGMERERPSRGSHAPGTYWWYNNWDFNTLLPIFEQCTKTRFFEEFARRIATPIGMEDYRVEDGFYQLEPSNSLHPAYAMRLSARDLARFGWLFAQGGHWEGREVVPEDWVELSTRPHSRSDQACYGYMWWSYPAGTFAQGSELDGLNAVDKFAALGTGGQLILVVPELELVFVHRGDTDNGRPVSGARVWSLCERVLDARRGEPAESPTLVAVKTTPFPNPGPVPPEHDVLPTEAAALEELVGDYELAPGMVVKLWIHQGRLFARSPEGEVELFRYAPDRFFARALALDLAVRREDSGAVTGMDLELEGRALFAGRLE